MLRIFRRPTPTRPPLRADARAQNIARHQSNQRCGPRHGEENELAAHGPDVGSKDLQPDRRGRHCLLGDGPGLPRPGQEGAEGSAAVLPCLSGRGRAWCIGVALVPGGILSCTRV